MEEISKTFPQINSLSNQPALPEESTNSPINSPFSNKPVLIILLVVFLVILSSLITYFLVKSQAPSQRPVNSSAPTLSASPTPSPIDEMVNWKTYKNEEIGISFKYPTDWETLPITIEGYKELYAVIGLAPAGGSKNAITEPVKLYYWNNKNNLPIDQFEKQLNSQMEHPLGIDFSRVQKVIGSDPNIPALFQIDAICEPVLCDKFLIPHKDKIFDLTSAYTSITDLNVMNLNQQEIFKKIFDTFKFN